MGLAWLAAPALVRGRRGRIATIVGALMAALGLVTVAGNVLFDFWTGAHRPRARPRHRAGAVRDLAGSAGVAVVGTVTLFGLLGPLVAYAGLARAGVTGWWLLAPAVASLAASVALTFSPLPYAGFALVGAIPVVVVGLRMIRPQPRRGRRLTRGDHVPSSALVLCVAREQSTSVGGMGDGAQPSAISAAASQSSSTCSFSACTRLAAAASSSAAFA